MGTEKPCSSDTAAFVAGIRSLRGVSQGWPRGVAMAIAARAARANPGGGKHRRRPAARRHLSSSPAAASAQRLSPQSPQHRRRHGEASPATPSSSRRPPLGWERHRGFPPAQLGHRVTGRPFQVTTGTGKTTEQTHILRKSEGPAGHGKRSRGGAGRDRCLRLEGRRGPPDRHRPGKSDCKIPTGGYSEIGGRKAIGGRIGTGVSGARSPSRPGPQDGWGPMRPWSPGRTQPPSRSDVGAATERPAEPRRCVSVISRPRRSSSLWPDALQTGPALPAQSARSFFQMLKRRW